MTKQKQYLDLPKIEENHLGLQLKCGKCATIRVFKIDANLSMLLNKKMRGFEIESSCENCGLKSKVGVGWISTDEGYSYREIEKGEKIMEVEDSAGLSLASNKS